MTNTPLAPVTLRTGHEVPGILLATTSMSMDGLTRGDAMTSILLTFDLVSLARHADYRIFPDQARRLHELGLLTSFEPPVMHDVVRQIVLASFDGEGFELQRVRPVA